MIRYDILYLILCVIVGPFLGYVLFYLLFLLYPLFSGNPGHLRSPEVGRVFQLFFIIIAYGIGVVPALLNALLMIAITTVRMSPPVRIALAPAVGALSAALPLYLLGGIAFSQVLSPIGAVVSLVLSVFYEVAVARWLDEQVTEA